VTGTLLSTEGCEIFAREINGAPVMAGARHKIAMRSKLARHVR